MIKIVSKYKTIKDFGTAEVIIKRSRFIANAKPVLTEDDAVNYINALKQKYWDARHNVYAYILRENNIMRYSDDGEPSGTAGVPILEILKKEGLTDVVVVVTRYFGGILLGTGGLVHAYSQAAKDGIETAGTVEMMLCREFTIKCDYNMIGKIQYEIAEMPDAFCGEIKYGESVEAAVYAPAEEEEAFEKMLIDKTNGGIELTKGGIDYFEKE